jgi:hypothetical protein
MTWVTQLGLLLVSASGDRDQIHRIRKSIIARNSMSTTRRFWAANGLVTRWTLAFLSEVGPLPLDLIDASLAWIEQQQFPPQAMGQALELLAWSALGRWNHPRAIALICHLLASYSVEGWRGSALLLVPPQHAYAPTSVDNSDLYADSGIMTTSMVLASLAQWRRAAQPRSNFLTLPTARFSSLSLCTTE